MAQHRRGLPSITMPMPFLAQVAVTALMMLCAASTTTTAQPQTLPTLPVPPQPTTPTMPSAAAPAVPSQLPAPCPPPQATLAPCLRFFTGNSSSSSSPPEECCAQIRAMFQSQAPCLCAAMASGPAAQLGGLGAALGQLLPTACDLPANACSSGTTTSGGDPAGTTTTGSGATDAAAVPETGPAGVGTTTVPGAGGAGVKSVPGLLDTGAAAPGSRGVSAGALLMSLLGVYLVATLDRIMHC